METVKKVSKILQKISTIGAFVLSCLCFVYALGYMTDLECLFFVTDKQSIYLKNSDTLYYAAQDFNFLLFNFSLVLVVLSITLFIWFSHKRRYYYLTNYISNAVIAVLFIVIACLIFGHNATFKADFLRLDFAFWKQWADIFGFMYTESTTMLDLGFVLGAILIVWAVVMFANLALKFLANRQFRKEEALYQASKNQTTEQAHAKS